MLILSTDKPVDVRAELQQGIRAVFIKWKINPNMNYYIVKISVMYELVDISFATPSVDKDAKPLV